MQTTCKILSYNVMGKSTMGLGQYSGRIGGLVFAKGDNGTQIIRTYQPSVKNPRTDGQQTQRAKLNLAGRISAAVPSGLIYSLASNGRSRRGAFVRGLIESITVTQTNGDYNAVIAPAAVTFAKGDFAPINPNATAQGTDLTISWTDISGDPSLGITDQAVVTAVFLFVHRDAEVKPVVLTMSADITQRTISYTPPAALRLPEFDIHCYVIVTDVSASVASTITSGVAGGSATIQAALSNGEGLSNLKWFESNYAGSVQFS